MLEEQGMFTSRVVGIFFIFEILISYHDFIITLYYVMNNFLIFICFRIFFAPSSFNSFLMSLLSNEITTVGRKNVSIQDETNQVAVINQLLTDNVDAQLDGSKSLISIAIEDSKIEEFSLKELSGTIDK